MKFSSSPSAANGGIKACVERNQYSPALSPEAIKWNGDQTFLFFLKLGINQHDSFSHYHLSTVHQMLMLMSIRKDHLNPSGILMMLIFQAGKFDEHDQQLLQQTSVSSPSSLLTFVHLMTPTGTQYTSSKVTS